MIKLGVWIGAMLASLLIWGVIFAIAGLVLGVAFGSASPPRHFHGDNTVIVQFASQQNVAVLCEIASRGALVGRSACAPGGSIIMPNPCQERGWYAELMCHELAHVNGWGPDH